MSAKNLIVRGGADFSGIKQELAKTQQQLNGFQTSVNKSMANVSKSLKLALGYVSIRAITGFVKATTDIASDLTEVQNVVDVVFGSMASDINSFAKTSIEQFGLSELSAKKYSSTMGAMLKSSGIAGTGVRDMALDLTKLSADMASFYNIDNDAAFQKIMSGMSGMSMPLKELGINMNVANLEAFAMSKGISKSYQKMAQAEQTMLRYNYLLSVTGDAQNDFSRNSQTWANQTKILSQQWEILKGSIGAGFINMLMPVVTGFNVLIKKMQVAAEYFKAFTALIFGSAAGGSQGGAVVETMADSLGDAEDGFGDVGKAGKKAGKDLKGALAGFDEINTIADKAGDSAGGLDDVLGGIGGVGAIDMGSVSGGVPNIDIDTSKIESKLGNLKSMFSNFYNDWVMKDFFKGFRNGLDLINFGNIKTNFSTAFGGLTEIAQTALTAMQPMYQAYGEALGTYLKYGIAIAGNLFEPISLGFANFMENMKGPIQLWIEDTAFTISNGFKNLTQVFENIGQSWLNSIEKYKGLLAEVAEGIYTNFTGTFMLLGTIVADAFHLVTKGIKDFTEENKEDIQSFTDSILGIFTDGLGFINKIWSDVLGSLKKYWDEWGKDIVKGVVDFAKDIGKWFLYLWNDLVKPTWDVMMEWLTKIWDESLKGLIDELLGFVGRVGDLIIKLWEGVLKPLVDKILEEWVPKFKSAFEFILDIVAITVNGIAGALKDLMRVLNGIIDFIVGVFTGDWSRAWEGVVGIFGGLMDGLVRLFQIPMNILISGINVFIRSMNRIKIPDWVPGGIGGKGFTISEIPHLAKGGITNGPMLSVIGDNPGGREVVSPLDDLLGMITSAVSVATGSNGSSEPTTLIVKIGEDTILDRVISGVNRQSRITGETVILV